MEKHINLLFEQFEKNSAIAQEKINEILNVISSGRVPEEIMVSGTLSEIDALRDTYSKILSYAKNVSDDDFGTDKTISEIKNCIENSEKEKLAIRIQAVRAVMEKFVRVKSDIDIYVSELKPYQQKARELINSIESLSIENIEAQSQGAKVFIDALENENPDSEYGYELICNAKNFFPERVVRGLDRDKYYLGEESEAEIVNDEADISVSSDKISTEDNPNNKDEPLVESGDSSVAITVPENDEIYCYALNEGKTGSCKAAAFKSDIEKMNNDVRCIIPLLSKLGIMTSEQIFRFNVLLGGYKNNDTVLNNIEFALSKLTERGYVMEYKSGDSSVYCLSWYSTMCLKKDSIRRIKGFWSYSLGQFNIANTDNKLLRNMIDNIIRDNELLYDYLSVAKDTLNSRDYGKVQESFKRGDSSYDVDAIILGETYKCRLFNDENNYSDKTVIVLTEKYDIPSGFDEEKIILCDGMKIWKHSADDITLSVDGIEEITPVSSEELESNNVPEEIVDENTEKTIIQQQSDEPQKQEPVLITNAIEYEEHDDNHLENDVPSEESFVDSINELLNKKADSNEDLRSVVVDGVLLAKVASLIPGYDKISHMYHQLLLATDIPIQDRNYTDLALLDAFQDISEDNKCIMLSAYMFALLSPRRAYDYGIASQTDLFLHNFEEYFPGLEKVKPFFNKLTKVSSNLPGGFTSSIVALLGDEEINAKYLNDIKVRASELLITPKVKTKMRNLQPMYYSLFGQGSSLYDCLLVVQSNNTKDIDLVKMTLQDYCSEEKGVFILDDNKLETQVNEAWYKVNPGNKFDLDYDAKDRVVKHTCNRVKVLLDWYEMSSEIINKDLEIDRIVAIKTELIKEAQIAYDSLKNSDLSCVNVLRWMLDHVISYLKGSVSNAWIFENVLKSGVFSLDSNYVPIINPDLNLVKYYEPWRNAQRYIEIESRSLEETRKAILENEESIVFDNLNQLKLIDSLLHIDSAYAEADVHSSADHLKDEFEEDIELAYTYSQISESEKEKLVQLVKQHQEYFYENGDFGCWRQFIFALKEQVRELTKSKKDNLDRVLSKTIENVSDNPPAILLEAQKLLDSGEELNLAVVEEYINRYAAGENELIDNYKMSENTEDIFSTFYSDSVFEPILEECKRGNRRFSDLAYEYVSGHAPVGWVTKHKEASKDFLKNWPINRDGNTVKTKAFFSELGFVVDKVTSSGIKNGNICRYKVYVKPDKQGKQEYDHPISAFGTQMKTPFDVIVLLGTQTPSQIVNTVKELDLSELAIVILDKPFSLSERRTMCETYHTKTSQQNPFILIDQTLCIYLALHQKEERLPLLLMATLPFTTYQPFVRDGGSTSDEMFCGRISELRSIMDKNGASVVYGGRQLGKTALLERAAKRCNVPEQKSFAYYISIYDCDSEEKFVKKVSKEINKKTIGKISINEECSSIEDLCDQLERFFLGGKITELRLFIDEADKFLDSISGENYEKLQPLIDLRRNTTNNFKFVLAGLHNVCRAQKATANNGVFGQLGQPLCVKPLSPRDAIELISKPLKYLGFQIDRFPHLETILTTTNYYPGILQFFGYTLVETLTNNYKSYYLANANPPFPLQKEQLASVINSSDLNESIKEKFKLSLKLDPRYFMLARCIAYRYHFENNNNRWLGYSIDEIKEVADSYPIHCLEGLTKNDYRNLLNEMVEMGILSPENDSYRLRKASFIDVIGRDWDKVDEEILSNNG